MARRNYRKEAAKEAVSFILDNYRVIVMSEGYFPGGDYYKMRHQSNGSTITIQAGNHGYTIKKNGKIVKQEP